MSDLGRIVSVHRESWRGTAIAAIVMALIAIAIMVSPPTNEPELARQGAPLALGIPAVILVVISIARRRREVVVHEQGIVWFLDTSGAVRWDDIATVHAYPERKPAVLVVTIAQAGKPRRFKVSSSCERFGALTDAIVHRRPSTAVLPAARLRR